jgi:electron transfer flavoprotein alpha subunit
MTTLLIADHNNTSLQAATLNAATAATKMGGDVHVLIAGANAGAAAQAAARIAGVAKVLHADAPHLGQPTAENVAATVVALVKSGGYSHVLAPATGFGKNVAPRVAALLDVAQISEITAIESADTFVRPTCRQVRTCAMKRSDHAYGRGRPYDGAATGQAPIDPSAAPDWASATGQNDQATGRKSPARVVIPAGAAFAAPRTSMLGARRQPMPPSARPRGRRRLRVERLPDRAETGKSSRPISHRGRHFRRHPASRRNEGQQGHRGDQQGSRGADLPAHTIVATVRGPS